MALLQRSDLVYEYQWTADKGDNPKLTGFPDDVLLDRNEGYEVLPFINRFGAHHDLTGKAMGWKVETMIHDHLPGSIRSHANVEKWLVNNWKSY